MSGAAPPVAAERFGVLTGPLPHAICAALHLGAFAATWALAFEVRFDFAIPPPTRQLFWQSLPWVVFLKGLIFYLAGAHRSDWRFTTFADLVVLVGALTASVVCIFAIDEFLLGAMHIPLSILLADWALGIVALGGLRSVARFSRERAIERSRAPGLRNVVLAGSDESALALARLLGATPVPHCRVVGFLDVRRRKGGLRLGNLPVAKDLKELPAADMLLVPADSVQGERLRELLWEAESVRIEVKMIPPVEDLLRNKASVQVREVEINDLLRRPPIELHRDEIQELVESRVVMVTGAAGSIGSELVRQLVKLKPRELVLVDQTEWGLFGIEQELRGTEIGELRIYIADIVDQARLETIFAKHRPEIIFHAAAYKHVPMMEANPGEAVRNNTLGTRCVADLADRHGASRFVLISTDKAVDPSSVMGASKFLAERYVEALGQASQTRFVTVRFGNVLGSSGSVVEIFREQIRRGGPITLTHEETTRFFMTIPEAAQLVLQSAAMGDRGQIFLLEMGEPIRVGDLARDMLRLSGIPEEQVKIQVTGLRPGERLHERLHADEEKVFPTNHPGVRLVQRTPAPLWRVISEIEALGCLIYGEEGDLRGQLKRLVNGKGAGNSAGSAPQSAPGSAPREARANEGSVFLDKLGGHSPDGLRAAVPVRGD